ncbi:MAG: MFS transporter [Arachidicoccus sp.]|nr:MFS transporter [Arachidicoccus sp.]
MSNWKIRVSIFINYFIFAILMNSVGAVVLQVQRYFGVNESQASFLDGFKDVTIAVTSFFVASFLTKIGYKKSMLIALAVLSVGCFSLPLANTFMAIKILLALVGFCFGITKMCVYSIVGLITKTEKEHISLLSFLESFFMVGVLSGNFLFSYFIDDKNPYSSAWLHAYYVLGGLTIIAFLFLLFSSLDETNAKPAESENAGWGNFVEMLQLLMRPIVLSFIVCAFVYVLIEQSIMNWLPTFNNKVLKLPSTYSVLIAAILPVCTFLGRFLSGIIMKKISWIVALILCLICAAALILIAIPLANKSVAGNVSSWKEIPFAAYIFPMIGFFIAPIYPAINSIILSSFPKTQQAKISGWIVIFSALGGTLGSMITGHIFHSFGGEKAFYFSLVPVTILLIALIVFNKQHKKAIPLK